jgi:streptogramin lyase
MRRAAAVLVVVVATFVALEPAGAVPGDVSRQLISGVNDLVLGADGDLYGSGTVPAAILQLDPDDGTTTETFPIAAGVPDQLAPDDDGTVWFTIRDDDVLRNLDPTDGSITSGPALGGPWVDDLVVGPDGRVWFTSLDDPDGTIGAVDGSTVERFTDPGTNAGTIIVGPDGDHLWASSCPGLVEIDPVTEVFEHHDVGPNASCPGVMTVGPDDLIWFTAFDGIGRLDPVTDEVDVAHARTRDRYTGIAPAADGEVWALNNVWIVRVDPEDMDVDRYLLPQPNDGGDEVAREPLLAANADGGLWGSFYGQLLDVELASPDETDVTDPTATITTPAAGADYRDDVRIFPEYTCDDTESVVVDCVGGDEPPHVTIPFIGPGAPVPGPGDADYVVYARDAAGNTAEPTVDFHISRTCFNWRVTRFPVFGGHGTAGNDVIYGQGDAQDPLDARAGHDRVCGAGYVEGGTGNDRLEGLGFVDVLRGGAGRDLIFGGKGNDVLVGGPGVDVCIGGPGRDVFRGCEQPFQESAQRARSRSTSS